MTVDGAGRAKPSEDEMRGGQPGAEDLVGEIDRLAADPDSDDDEILKLLEGIGNTFSTSEVFAVLVHYDTPDLLG